MLEREDRGLPIWDSRDVVHNPEAGMSRQYLTRVGQAGGEWKIGVSQQRSRLKGYGIVKGLGRGGNALEEDKKMKSRKYE